MERLGATMAFALPFHAPIDAELVAGEVSQDRLINQADIFLYEAKKLGRNRVNGDYFR